MSEDTVRRTPLPFVVPAASTLITWAGELVGDIDPPGSAVPVDSASMSLKSNSMVPAAWNDVAFATLARIAFTSSAAVCLAAGGAAEVVVAVVAAVSAPVRCWLPQPARPLIRATATTVAPADRRRLIAAP
ncbi:hypothetical protein ACFQBT_00440 [Branchiibius cervicis]|uniref:Uncharacterized protein n=1 Tax=Branchiibius cervicis TaxID=908252 RepID=A0ABW2ANU5_9MICO